MDLSYGAEYEAFRDEVKSFLEEAWPQGRAAGRDHTAQLTFVAAAAPRVRDAGLLLLAADAFGAATRLIQMTIEYTKVREQFDTPLAQFQSVKHQIANMATDAEQCRGLLWYAAHAFDHIPGDTERSAALAKAHITERAMQVARDAVELHGGIGFTWECDVHMWFKRTMFDRAFLGTPAVHRERNAWLAGWSAS